VRERLARHRVEQSRLDQVDTVDPTAQHSRRG